MFGDDLNPSVTKARVGFGEVFGRTKEGGRWNGQRSQGGHGNHKRLREDASLKTMTTTECRCKANDAMMNATSK